MINAGLGALLIAPKPCKINVPAWPLASVRAFLARRTTTGLDGEALLPSLLLREFDTVHVAPIEPAENPIEPSFQEADDAKGRKEVCGWTALF
jgi:hypothetical protein